MNDTKLEDFFGKTEITKNSFFLLYIRNKFAHNQLVKKEFMDYFIKKVNWNGESSYSQCILEYFLLAKKSLKKEIGLKKRYKK